jgi:UDP-glucose 4-epimerase
MFNAYNIGTAVPTDVNLLAARLRSACQAALQARGLKIVVPEAQHGPPRAGDLRSSLVSPAKAERELDWRPTVGLEQGLRETVEWFAARGDL